MWAGASSILASGTGARLFVDRRDIPIGWCGPETLLDRRATHTGVSEFSSYRGNGGTKIRFVANRAEPVLRVRADWLQKPMPAPTQLAQASIHTKGSRR